MGLSLQLITLFCLAVGIQAVCDTGFNWHDGICYHFPSGIFRRSEAIKYCEKRRSTLPIIHSAAQEQYILNRFLFTSASVWNMWIGLTNNNGVYQWQDNSPIDYTNWMPGRPVYSDSGVTIEMLGNDFGGRWSDNLGNQEAAAFACMYPTTQVPPPFYPPSVICPAGYAEYDGKCYYFSPTATSTYNEANTYCQNNNSTQISIHNPQMMTFLVNKLSTLFFPKNVYTWIGLYLDDGEFKWEDGTFVDYTNWENQSPKDRSDRIQIHVRVGEEMTYGWTDFGSTTGSFVCQYSP